MPRALGRRTAPSQWTSNPEPPPLPIGAWQRRRRNGLTAVQRRPRHGYECLNTFEQLRFV
ncbi:hypothetical protein E4U24_004061 [Claviceps purpurea]|nr:hypothetical protein E4U37_000914 [Claviceps purpurea]KAG6245985.1 hypothetical protein E4U24_004061 [Claviceps purpurea]